MRYRFGEFELVPERYELRRGGEAVSLEPRVLEVLAYLVAHADRDPVALMYAASVHARNGQTAAALESLERAMALGYRHVDWIACEPDFEPLRADPRFRAVLGRRSRPAPAATLGRAGKPRARVTA